MLSLKEGTILVKKARETIAFSFSEKDTSLDNFDDKQGVFVTLHTFPGHELRGCIGFPEPIFPLNKGLIMGAKAAAFEDPRFMPLHKEELKNIVIEVSVLTMPEIIKVNDTEEYPKKVEVGKDGLIIEADSCRGLLLPIVATTYKWNAKEFLEQTCIKAGLPAERWKIDGCNIYKFQAQVFSEEKPEGEVKEI